MLSKLFYSFNIVKTALEIYARLTIVLAVDTDIICLLLQYLYFSSENSDTSLKKKEEGRRIKMNKFSIVFMAVLILCTRSISSVSYLPKHSLIMIKLHSFTYFARHVCFQNRFKQIYFWNKSFKFSSFWRMLCITRFEF